MALATDLQALKQILSDDKLHILLAIIQRVVVAPDRSGCRVLVSVLPEKRELIAQMSWEAVGQEAGFFVLPNVGDMVLVGQAEGDVDQAYVLRRLASADEKIPKTALDGSLVAKAGAGKSVWITSDTKINLVAGDAAGTENLVLGQQLKAVLTKFLTIFEAHTHVDSIGGPTQPPTNVADATDLQKNKIDNDSILSKIAFTEKGG